MNKGDGNMLVDICMRNDSEFVTVGVRVFKEWKLNNGVLNSKRGKFSKGKYSDMLVNCKSFKNSWITGTLKGEVLIWNGTSVSKCIKGKHEGPVDAIEVTKDYIFTGGRQGNIVILDEKFNEVKTLSISHFDSVCPGINAFAYDGLRLIIGTRGSEVFEVNFNISSSDISVKNVITAGHYSPCRKDNNEVWGLDVFPNKDQYISVSDDSTLRVWSTSERRMQK